MNLVKARAILQQSRSNIGRCLRILKGAKSNPSAYYRACKELSQAKADVKRLYTEYPDLKPVKVEQLSLFK